MNVQDQRVQQELKEGLGWLSLSPHNEGVLRTYVFLEERDDGILSTVKQDNFNSVSLNGALFFSVYFSRIAEAVKKPVMERLLEFLWAVGGSSLEGLLSRGHGFMSSSDNPKWREKVLGTAPAAMLSAGNAFENFHVSNRTMHWLLTADMKELRSAQALCTRAQDHAFSLIAGTMLARQDDEWQRGELLRRTVDAVPKILFGLPLAEVQEMQGYIEAGDAGVPVPVLPSLQLPAVDIPSAQTATWMETHLLRTYFMAALLSAGRDSRMRCALRFFLMLYPKKLFKDAIEYLPEEWIPQILPLLVETIPGGGVSMVLFASTNSEIYKKCRDICLPFLRQALEYADPEQFYYLMQKEKGMELTMEELRIKLARGLSDCVHSPDKQAAFDYLMDMDDLSDAVAKLQNIRPGVYRDLHHCMDLLREYVQKAGLNFFALRCVAFAGLIFQNSCIFNLTWLPGGKRDVELLCRIAQELCSRGLSTGEVLGIWDRLYEHSYWDDNKADLRKAVLTIGSAERVGDIAGAMAGGSVFLRSVALELLEEQAAVPGAKEAILSAAADSSKQVREQVAGILPKHPEWAEDYKDLLSSKKAAVRILAAEVLGKLGEREALEAALSKEKNAKAADAIRAALGVEAVAPVGSAADLAVELTKGSKLKKLSWLLDGQLQKVRNADGIADDTLRNAILLSYCELGRIGRSDTATGLSAGLDAGDLEKLAVQVFDRWFAGGAQAKHKWVLPFAAVYGGAAMTQRLSKAIHDWPEQQRGAIACDAVMALALSSDPAAIVIVDSISRKFKFRQVKTAAAAALENAARELGMSAEELADRIVPDLGFGRDGKRIFDYGKRSFTVRLTSALELEITNDQGKKVKSMPTPGKTDDPQAVDAYEDFKTMKKQIKTTVAAQRARLESAFSVLRCWESGRWQALFVENPIMHQFAMSLVWGVYEDGKLTDTFRYMEDGTFNTVDEDEYTLPENAKIGLVHPVELNGEMLESWKQQLEDYEIKQSIDQLSRTVHTLDPAKTGQKTLEDFGGRMLNALSLSGKLLQQGWYRGSVQDGGAFYCFFREDKELGIGCELRFSGTAVGYDDGENVTVFDAVFYTGTLNRGSYVYDTLSDEQIVPLGSVPTRYYSEIVHQLTRATASSTETNDNWRSERHE